MPRKTVCTSAAIFHLQLIIHFKLIIFIFLSSRTQLSTSARAPSVSPRSWHHSSLSVDKIQEIILG